MAANHGRAATSTLFVDNRHGAQVRLLQQQLARLPTRTLAGVQIRRVQLTYDDGPDRDGNTREVLDALNATGARATFYLVGKRVAQQDHWRLVFDIAATGHWLGNHAYDWNDEKDNHVFLQGTLDERTEKILLTEWALRDALIRGRDDATQRNKWNSIPAPNRAYVEDVIANGTGRFRTPGFRSKPWSSDGNTTLAAIDSANGVLAAAGLRPLAITKVTSWFITREGVTNDPEDWRSGRTKAEIESKVREGLDDEQDSILLHSRLDATAAATRAIVADIQRRGWGFAPTVQGVMGSILPHPGFARLRRISNPPTASELATARTFFRSQIPSIGSVLAGYLALGVFQLAHRAGRREADAFLSELVRTTVKTDKGVVPVATWMNGNSVWRLFFSFYDKWRNSRSFPSTTRVSL